jgi:hypothetical protein
MTVKETTVRIGNRIYRAKGHFGKVAVYITETQQGKEFFVAESIVDTSLHLAAIAKMSRLYLG